MFRKLSSLKKHHQFAYTLLIALGLITTWRGVWKLLDLYLFPQDIVLSSLISLALGVSVLAITHHRLS